MSVVHDQANAILGEIAAVLERRRELEAGYAAEAEALKERHAGKLEPLKAQLKALEKDLEKLAKARREDLFRGSDRVDLPAGSLLHVAQARVVRARAVTVEKLEELGFQDGVRIEKRVDWDSIEQWPLERLAAIGTERKIRESFPYELAEGEQP